jgi:hypothetical protein
MFWGKHKNKNRPSSSAPSDFRPGSDALMAKKSSERPQLVLQLGSLAEIEPGYSGSVVGHLSLAGIVLGPNEAIRSRATMTVKAGERFELETEISCQVATTNGEPLVYSSGLLLYDINGDVVQWWTPKPPIGVAEGTRLNRETILVPDEAVLARIGVCGAWSSTGTTSNGAVLVRSATARLIIQ